MKYENLNIKMETHYNAGGMEYSHMQSESKVTFQQEDSTQDRQHFAGYNHTQAIDGRDSFADTGSEFSGSQLPGESVSRTSSFTCNGEDGTRTPMTLSEAFDLLFEVYSDGYLNRDIPIRTRASPIYPSQPQFYLYSSDQCKATKETGMFSSLLYRQRMTLFVYERVCSFSGRKRKIRKDRQRNSENDKGTGCAEEKDEKGWR